MRSGYGFDWIPGTAVLGAVLVLLIVPPFALIALALVAVVVLAALVALAAAILASPYLLLRYLRGRLAEREIPQPQLASRPQPEPVAARVAG